MSGGEKTTWSCPLCSGSVKVERGQFSRAMVPHLFGVLGRVEACKVSLDGGRVVFVCGADHGAGRWNVLALFRSGELEVDHAGRRVHYRLRPARMMLAWMAFVTIFGVLTSFAIGGLTGVLIWTCMYLIVYTITVFFHIDRFRRFLREAVMSAPKLSDSEDGGDPSRSPGES